MHKVVFLVVFMSLSFSGVGAQEGVNFQSSEILVLDTYEKTFRNILSNDDSGIQIRRIQVKTQRADSISYLGGLDIRLANEYVSETISSTGVAITGDLGIALGGGRQEVVRMAQEQIFLELDDLNTLIDFLNSTIQTQSRYRPKGMKPASDRTWRITFDNGLVWGFAYDSGGRVKWFYYLQLGDARFEIPVESAKEMLMLIARTRRWLQDEFPILDE